MGQLGELQLVSTIHYQTAANSRASAYEWSSERSGTHNRLTAEDYKALSSQLQWLYFDVKCRQHGKPKRTITHRAACSTAAPPHAHTPRT